MSDNSKYYIVDKKVLPEVFIKVMEVKKLMESNKAKTIQDAVATIGISRSAFYKYRDSIFCLSENSKSSTVTLATNLDNTPGLLSNVLNVIAGEGANILTINQTIPINNIAHVTITIETSNIHSNLNVLLEKLENIKGVLTLKIIGRE